jgi:hypothetical protein
MQARRRSFQLSFAQGPRISDRCFLDVTFAEAADASRRTHTRGAPILFLEMPSALKTAGSIHGQAAAVVASKLTSVIRMMAARDPSFRPGPLPDDPGPCEDHHGDRKLGHPAMRIGRERRSPRRRRQG